MKKMTIRTHFPSQDLDKGFKLKQFTQYSFM